MRPIGEPGLFSHIEALGTPGQLLTMRLLEPFSYQVGWDDFAAQAEVRGVDGKVVPIGRTRLKEGVPVEGVITGPRHFFASPGADAPSTGSRRSTAATPACPRRTATA